MTTLYLGAAAFAGLGVLLLVLGLANWLRSGSQLEERLQTYSVRDDTRDDVPVDISDEQPSGLAGRLNAYITGRSFAESIAIDIARAGVKLTVPEFVIIKAAAALVPLALLGLVARSLLLGIVVGGICFFIPDIWLRQRRRKRCAAFVLQLPETIDLIVGGLRAGFSLQHSLQNVAKQAQEPTATEFNRVGQEMQLGVPLMTALDNLARRIESDDLDMIVSVFKIQSRIGGNLATILETVSTTIRERVKLKRQIQVITSMQRFSGYVVGALPIGLGIIMFMVNPSYMMEIFHWDMFLCIPVFALIMMIFGFLIIRKLVDIKV